MVSAGHPLRIARGANRTAIPGDSLTQQQHWLEPLGRSFRFEIRMTPEPEGGYSIFTPQLPGAVSEGENAEEAVRNIAEALRGALETYLEDDTPIPWKTETEPLAEGETRLWIVVNV